MFRIPPPPRHATSNKTTRPATRRTIRTPKHRLSLERLEERALLSGPGAAEWIFQGPSPITGNQWTRLANPSVSGAITAVAINPQNPSEMYVSSTNGGIWKTENANLTVPAAVFWNPLTDNLPSLATGDVAFSPLDSTGKTLFAVTGTRSSLAGQGGRAIGVLKTTDGGANWTPTRLKPTGVEPIGISILPSRVKTSTGQLVLVGSNLGLFFSTNGGSSYTRELVAPWGSGDVKVTQLIGDPNNANVFYVAIEAKGIFRGIYSSSSNSVTWTAMNSGLPTDVTKQTNIQIASQGYGATTYLFAFLNKVDSTAEARTPGIYRMNTATDNSRWSFIAKAPATFSTTGGGGNTITLVADPRTPNTFYLGSVGRAAVSRTSFNNLLRYEIGTGWDYLDPAGPDNTYPHPDFRDLVFLGNTLIATSDGGIFFLPDTVGLTQNWQSLNGSAGSGHALAITELMSVGYDSNSHVLFGGEFDNGTSYQVAPGSQQWETVAWGDGGNVAVDTSALASKSQSIRYSSAHHLADFRRQVFDANGKFVANSDFGLFPNNKFPFGLAAGFFAPIAMDAIAPTAEDLADGESTRIAIGGVRDNKGVIIEADNPGTAAKPDEIRWREVSKATGLQVGSITALAYGGKVNGVDNPLLLYAADNDHVYVRTVRNGKLTETPKPFPDSNILGLALNPNNGMDLFVLTQSALWETADGGTTWFDRTGNMRSIVPGARSITDAAVGPLNVVIVGGLSGSVGEMVSDKPGEWSTVGTGLPRASIFDLKYNADDDVLAAAEFGRGAWTLPDASTVLVKSLGQITIIAGAAGTGTLDHFLTATQGTITPADVPASATVTLSTGALEGVGAGVPISITADHSIVFENGAAPHLATSIGTTASFTSNNGEIRFTNGGDTVSTAGGALRFAAGTDLTVGNLSAPSITLDAAGDVDLAGSLTATETVTITSSEGAIFDGNGGDDVGPLDHSVEVTAPTLLMLAQTGIGAASESGFGPLETQVSNLRAVTSTGGIHVTNGVTEPVALNIIGAGSGPPDGVVETGTSLNAGGDVELINHGSINVVNAGAVILNHGHGDLIVRALGTNADIRTGGQDELDAIAGDGGGNVLVSADRDVFIGNPSGKGDIAVFLIGAMEVTAGRDLILDYGSALAGEGEEQDLTATAGRNIILRATGGSEGANITNDADIELQTGPGGTLIVDSGDDEEAIATEAGNITISADTLRVDSRIVAPQGTLALQQAGTTRRDIDLGAGATTDALNLSDSTLDHFEAQVLDIGRSDNPGNLIITGPVTPHEGFDLLNLGPGGQVSESGPGAIRVKSLAVQALGAVALGRNSSTVTNLSISSANGGVEFRNAVDLAVTSVNGDDGITGSGRIVLESSADNTGLTVSQPIRSTGSDIRLKFDRMSLGAELSAPDRRVTLEPFSEGRLVSLGTNAGAASTLGLAQADLGHVTAGVLQVGNAASGNLTVNNTVRLTKVPTLSLVSSGGITEPVAPAAGSLAVPNLVIRSANAVRMNNTNSVTRVMAATSAPGQGISFSNTGALTIGVADGVIGLTTKGAAIVITAGGHLTDNQPIDAGQGTILLSGQGVIELKAALNAARANVIGSRFNDTFNITPLRNTEISIDGLAGTNTLNLRAASLQAASVPGALLAYLTPTNAARIRYTNIRPMTIDGKAINGFLAPDTADRTRVLAGLSPNERFIQVLYLNVLSRPATRAEVSSWLPLFDRGLSRAQVQALIATELNGSVEARTNLVDTWFRSFLGRAPVNGDDGLWITMLATQSEEQVLSGILGTAEFFNRAQTLITTGSTNKRFVAALFQMLLHRPGDSAGLTFWTNQVSVVGRQGVALGLLQSTEFRNSLVEAYFNVLLRRAGDAAGRAFWVNSAEDIRDIRIHIESSGEFFDHG